MLGQLPRSKQKWLAQEIWKGIEAGEKAYQFVCRREGKTFQEQADGILKKMRVGSAPGLKIFAQYPDKLKTPVLDALELAGLADD